MTSATSILPNRETIKINKEQMYNNTIFKYFYYVVNVSRGTLTDCILLKYSVVSVSKIKN